MIGSILWIVAIVMLPIVILLAAKVRAVSIEIKSLEERARNLRLKQLLSQIEILEKIIAEMKKEKEEKA